MRSLPALDAPQNERLLTRHPEAPRVRDAAVPARRSAVERLAADRAKYVRGPPGAGPGRSPEGSNPGASEGTAGDPRPPARVPGAVARRAIARKPLRPDSLVIYRQKCDFVRGQGADSSRGGLVKKLFQGSGKDKTSVPPETSRVGEEVRARREEAVLTKPGSTAASAVPGVPAPPARAASPAPCGTPTSVPAVSRVPELRGTRRGGLQRSQSDLSSRYSSSLAECDTFFQFCGLEPEVVEALGRENFSAGSDRVTLKVRSVSVATSDSGFSRHSGGEEGLQEEELTEQVPSTTSVIERNARIIKWLYTCKKAKEKTGQGLQGPA
ncbi:protein FAM110C [Zalophus californianus]|uniref:Protein FAM110C n=1 Tax=Zalophus californianus TaxID=9704 RepID=A0A6J2FH66_ZALCA|nr:protein FAM110C [Zalophus californianus]XP_027479330.1 protein FAM110C [Zalophus californianus]XP_027479331.1 protein FAM110C [Zalophus californianus]